MSAALKAANSGSRAARPLGPLLAFGFMIGSAEKLFAQVPNLKGNYMANGGRVRGELDGLETMLRERRKECTRPYGSW